jgi:hypothetical protein
MVGATQTKGKIFGLHPKNDLLFVAAGTAGMQVLDITEFFLPRLQITVQPSTFSLNVNAQPGEYVLQSTFDLWAEAWNDLKAFELTNSPQSITIGRPLDRSYSFFRLRKGP